MPRGAKPLWEPNDIDIKNAEKLGGLLTQEQLADFYGCTVTSLRTAFKNHPNLRKAYDRSRADAISKVAQNLVQKAMEGNVACMIFFLKAQAGWREVTKMEHESMGGANGTAETAAEARREVLGRLGGIAKRLQKETSTGGVDGGGPGELEGSEVRLDVLGEAGSVSA